MSWFSRSRKAKVTQSRRNKSRADLRRALFEQLEPRQVMDAVPLVWAGVTLDASDEVAEGFPEIFEPPAAIAGPQTTDAGDYYYYFSEQIDLLRAQDEFVVAYNVEEDIEDLVAALTGSGDPLQDYVLKATLEAGKIVLNRPADVAYTAIDLEDVEAIDGVLWAAAGWHR